MSSPSPSPSSSLRTPADRYRTLVAIRASLPSFPIDLVAWCSCLRNPRCNRWSDGLRGDIPALDMNERMRARRQATRAVSVTDAPGTSSTQLLDHKARSDEAAVGCAHSSIHLKSQRCGGVLQVQNETVSCGTAGDFGCGRDR